MADTETPQPSQPTVPQDSSYLFNARAAAIASTADNLSDGLNSIASSLANGNWDDPAAAREAASTYAKKLAQRFPEENDNTFNRDTVPETAPVRLSDVKPDDNAKLPMNVGSAIADIQGLLPFSEPVPGHKGIGERVADSILSSVTGKKPEEETQDETQAKLLSQINKWEKLNLDTLTKTEDPLYSTIKEPLSKSIQDYASNARRNILGKTQDGVSEEYNRMSEGAVSNILKLFGADEAVKNLYEHTDPSADKSIRGKLESALGSTAGFVGSSVAGGPLGLLTYGGLNAAGATKDTYQKSLERTGDSGRASIAASVEAASQGTALFGGSLAAKAFKPAVAGAATEGTEAVVKAVEDTFGKEAAPTIGDWLGKAAREGIKIGTLNTSAGIISEGANRYGGGKDAIDSVPNTAEDWKGYAEDFVINAGIGAALHALPKAAPPEIAKPDVPDPNLQSIKVRTGPEAVKENQLKDIPAPTGPVFSGTTFNTESGQTYQVTQGGRAAARTDTELGVSYHPLERTFYVDAPTAAKIALLEKSQMPDGSQPYLSTDGDVLHINSAHVDSDLNPVQTATGRLQTEVKTLPIPSPGLYPIDIGKTQNGLISKVPSYFGDKITSVNQSDDSMPGVGAAGPFRMAPSQALQRVLASDDISDEVKERVADKDFHPIIPKGVKEAEAVTYLKTYGPGAGYDRIMQRGEHEQSGYMVALARTTADAYQKLADIATENGKPEEASKYLDLSSQMLEQWDLLRSATGHTLGQVGDIGPSSISREFMVSARERAKDEAAQAEGISRQELDNNEKELKQVTEELSQATVPAEEKAKAATEKEASETDALDTTISKIEDEANKRHEEAVSQTEKAAAQDEAQAKEIEETNSKSFESENKSLKEALQAAQDRVKSLEDAGKKRAEEATAASEKQAQRVEALEAKGKKKAEDASNEAVKNAEAVVSKLKNNPKAKPEAVEAAEKNLERRKNQKENVSVTDGMTPEEKKEYQKLLRDRDKPVSKDATDYLKASEAKELSSLQEKIARGQKRAASRTPELSPEEKAKIKALRDRAASKRDEQSAISPLDRLSKREKSAYEKLKEKRATYPKTATEGKAKEDFLTPEEKSRIAELTQRQKALKERSDRTAKTIQAKIDEAAPKAKKMRELLEKAQSTSGRFKDDLQRAAFKIRDEGEKDTQSPLKNNFWRRWWIGNEISSPNTFLRKTIGEVNQAVAIINGYLGNLQFGEAKRFGGNALKTGSAELSNFFSDVRDAFHKDGFAGVQKLLGEADKLIPRGERLGLDTKKGNISMSEASKDRLSRNDFDSSTLKTNYKLLKPLVSALNTVFGTFATGRAIFLPSLFEGFANAEAYRLSKEEGLRGEDLRQAISEKLFNSEATYKGFLKQAQDEAQQLSQYGTEWSPRDVRIRAAELMQESRDQEINTAALEGMNYFDLNKTPPGWIGKAFLGLGKFVDNYLGFKYKGKDLGNPISYLFPFLNIGANLLRNQFMFVPIVGHLQALGGDPREFIDGARNPDYMHPRVRQNLIGQANMGVFLTAAGLLTKLYMQKDDKNPFFDVHGAGPSDPGQAAMFRADGHRPFSVEINTGNERHIVPLPVVTGNFALMLGLVGSINDSFKYDRIKSPPITTGDKTVALSAALAAGLVRSVGNEPFFKNWGMMIEAYDNKDWRGALDSLAIQPAKGFIPLIGLERYINKYVSQPADSYKNLYAKMLADTPFGTLASGQRLNPIGEPIKEDWLGDHGPFAPYLVAQNTDKDFAWLSDNGYNIPMMKHVVTVKGSVGEDELDPAKSPGSIVDNTLSDAERAKVLTESAPQVREILRAFREQYGASAYSDAVQKALNKSIDGVRNATKYRLYFK